MADALTPEQINLLRGLPGQLSELKKSPDAERLFLAGLLTRIGSPEYSTVVRTRAADLLLATIDSERERVLGEIRGHVEQIESEVPNLSAMRHSDAYGSLDAIDSLLDFAQAVQGNFPTNPQKETGQ